MTQRARRAGRRRAERGIVATSRAPRPVGTRARLRAGLERLRARGRVAPEVVLLEEEVRRINRFPDQNPNPVLRIDQDGVLLYANPASEPLLPALELAVGDPVPAGLMADIDRAADGGDPLEVRAGLRTFQLLPVRVPEMGFVNVYGTDITARKLVARFPDQNPNPVFRVDDAGRLIYANAASEPLVQAFHRAVGEMLPGDLFASLSEAADAAADAEPARIEVSGGGRTFALKPVRIPEFGFINVYGTDITALRAMDKFPDQNPNPVLRVTPDGVLRYANPASEPVRWALGAEVGQQLSAEVWAEIARRVESGSAEILEVEHAGRLFALLVVQVFEFGFINLYGTDITAVRAVELANAENERLLLNILPEPIAQRLRQGERVIADRFDEVTLLFADIVGFTQLSSTMTAAEVVDVLNRVFSLFDELVDRYELEKIKTIGDAYMVVGGLPPRMDDHVARVAEMALALSGAVERIGHTPAPIEFRIGIHTGPAVAGVIGLRKFIYDVWGDTVNLASRMETHSMPGRIQVTGAVYERLRDRYRFEARGTIDVRGKGPMPTWFLLGPAEQPQAAAEPSRSSVPVSSAE